jgi:hypothetical protein
MKGLRIGLVACIHKIEKQITSHRPWAFLPPLAYIVTSSMGPLPILVFTMTLDHFLPILLLQIEAKRKLDSTKISGSPIKGF